MRTITFEVEVDDYLPETLTPSIDNPNFADTPIGRMFLCGDYADGGSETSLRLMQMSSIASKDGTSRRYFTFTDIPKELRVVKVSNPDGSFVNVIPDGLVKPSAEQEHNNPPVSSEAINTAVLRSAIVESVNEVYDLVDDLIKRATAGHEEVMKHFKQVHEEHLADCTHFAELEERMTKRINEGSLHAANTANTIGHDILQVLPELEDRIKAHIGEPDDAPVQHGTDDVSPKALLKALEIVSHTIINASNK